ncbi:glutaredoxin domain-containing protein [Archaeoglobus neptunius]|uniref:glutaredoxin domain-containing protein n=1 Tax=Archaeoglobus neptunius TaxID=2798580 RepID=UPI00192716D1|nr:glutaredoxin domain-containing protein [Archaeoglobus neptunius]
MRRVVILFLIAAVAGCVAQPQVDDYWNKINSFKADVIYIVGNKSYRAEVTYVKPDRVLKIENGTAVLIDNGTKTIVSEGRMFKLAASKDDFDTIDPFVAVLNNLDSMSLKADDGKLIANSGDLSFVIQLNHTLPEKIAVVQRNSTIVVARYVSISINDAEINRSAIYDLLHENESMLQGVYYFFSPHCPHCSKVKSLVEMCNITYCNVSNMTADCVEVMQRYGVVFVPTIVSINELNTTVFVGEKNVREGFGEWCMQKVE